MLALAISISLFTSACSSPVNEVPQTTPPQQTICDHYDMDVDEKCDECGETLSEQTHPLPTETQLDPSTVVLHLRAEYTLGAYSSGVTTLYIREDGTASILSVVDTSAVGQGKQQIRETGSWSYDAAADSYTVIFENSQYFLTKNTEGLFSVQYSFTMRGQTGGTQDISVFLMEAPFE